MNNRSHIKEMMPPVQTINECKKEVGRENPAHSNGKPDATRTASNICVRFAPLSESTFEIRIKRSLATKLEQLKPVTGARAILWAAGFDHNPG